MKKISIKEAVGILKSVHCDCGNRKKERHVFCLSCFSRLSPRLRDRLYQRIGEGFEEAVSEAREVLGRKADE